MPGDDLDCPVCPRREVAAGTEACPNCHTDLRPLWRVRALAALASAPPASPAPVPARASRWPAFMAGFLLAGVLALAVPRPAARSAPSLPPSGPATPAPAAAPPPPAAAPWPALADELGRIRGLEVQVEDAAVLVRLPPALFTPGTAELPASAQEALQRVAVTLASGPAGLEVTVEGLTDRRGMRPGAPWTDNWTLGLARAQAAAARLRLALGPQGPRLRLDSREDASGSRTVALRLQRER